MTEIDLQSITARCAVDSYLYISNGCLELISSEKSALLTHQAIVGGLVYQLKQSAEGNPYLSEITQEASGTQI